jgi:hypothetical protein
LGSAKLERFRICPVRAVEFSAAGFFSSEKCDEFPATNLLASDALALNRRFVLAMKTRVFQG